MRIFFDTEFIEDGKTIDLISIGLIREDGKALYLENMEADLSNASTWVLDNVLPRTDLHTWLGTNCTRVAPATVQKRAEIARQIVAFVGPSPEFWAYYADYDWVVLCQLYGTMVDLPEGWPMYCKDFKQEVESYNTSWEGLFGDSGEFTIKPLPEEAAHNALEDAQWLVREQKRFDKHILPWEIG